MVKEKVICDTDVLIDYWNIHSTRHKAVKHELDKVIGVKNFVLCFISKFELIQGTKDKSDLKKMITLMKYLDFIHSNREIESEAFRIFETYKLSHGLSIADSIIAGSTIHYDLSLFTYNTKDYKMISGLKLYKP